VTTADPVISRAATLDAAAIRTIAALEVRSRERDLAEALGDAWYELGLWGDLSPAHSGAHVGIIESARAAVDRHPDVGEFEREMAVRAISGAAMAMRLRDDLTRPTRSYLSRVWRAFSAESAANTP
jgi:hypothetical protein